MSLAVAKFVIEINSGELAIRFSKGSVWKLLKVVKSEVGRAEGYDQHHGEILERGQVKEDELLEYLLKQPEHKDMIVDNDE